MLVNKQVSIVHATVPNTPFALFNKTSAMDFNIPVFSRTPPRDNAHNINEIVDIILESPPLDKSSSTACTPVFATYPFCAADNTLPKSTPCKVTANKTPIKIPPTNPGIAGILNITNDITNIGAINSTGDKVLNVNFSVSCTNNIFSMSKFLPEYLNPITPYIIIHIISDGIVEYVIYFI